MLAVLILPGHHSSTQMHGISPLLQYHLNYKRKIGYIMYQKVLNSFQNNHIHVQHITVIQIMPALPRHE